jgi:hypothetical protein
MDPRDEPSTAGQNTTKFVLFAGCKAMKITATGEICVLATAPAGALDPSTAQTALRCLEGSATIGCGYAVQTFMVGTGCGTACMNEIAGNSPRGQKCQLALTPSTCMATRVPCTIGGVSAADAPSAAAAPAGFTGAEPPSVAGGGLQCCCYSMLLL